MYKTILVPVDISEDELTSKAVKHALSLAKKTGAKLHILHVLPISSAIVNAYSLGYDEIKDKATIKAEDDLKTLIDTIDFPDDKLSYSIAFGSPRDEITAAATEINADLIVIGSRRPNMTTHLLGSNASGVVKYSTTSVLVIR
ncbi:universal stress protein [Photorhabdus luminescens]|uniref:Universal stress protein n=1 Tax=Photorhabdus luminescens subsp. mexicana TaxID=2100167 RepID=A0A4R4JFS6_PHOLU|nr:universal stress protein [Photorhabdus luminescens]MCW7760313.1 universal stress protein [Photorhabdus luminescens subsp. venezuelensis]OWO84602.1 universal stress protein [Photorhabdus luminescens]TDB52994.1 universal stress protein [Photorhabdus luminescens subsp. mexicana]